MRADLTKAESELLCMKAGWFYQHTPPRIYIPAPPSHIHVCRSWVKTGDGGTRKTSHGFPSSAPPAQPDPPLPSPGGLHHHHLGGQALRGDQDGLYEGDNECGGMIKLESGAKRRMYTRLKRATGKKSEKNWDSVIAEQFQSETMSSTCPVASALICMLVIS